MIGELAALGAAISWAIAPILYRNALINTNPISANIVRCATNGGVLMLILLLSGNLAALTSLPIGTVILVVVSGIIGLGIGDTLYMLGLKYIGVARAVPLAATYPLFSFVWAVFLLGQPLSLISVVGAVIIVLGIWLLSRDKNEVSNKSKGRLALIGVVGCVITAVIWSISITLMDVAVSSNSTLEGNYAIITLRIATIALFFMLLAPVIDRKHGFLKMKRRTIIGLCIGGLIANGVGWFLMNYSFLNTSYAQAVPISSTSPLFAAVAGFVFFHEKATVKTILGVIAVVVGVILIFMI